MLSIYDTVLSLSSMLYQSVSLHSALVLPSVGPAVQREEGLEERRREGHIFCSAALLAGPRPHLDPSRKAPWQGAHASGFAAGAAKPQTRLR